MSSTWILMKRYSANNALRTKINSAELQNGKKKNTNII